VHRRPDAAARVGVAGYFVPNHAPSRRARQPCGWIARDLGAPDPGPLLVALRVIEQPGVVAVPDQLRAEQAVVVTGAAVGIAGPRLGRGDRARPPGGAPHVEQERLPLAEIAGLDTVGGEGARDP